MATEADLSASIVFLVNQARVVDAGVTQHMQLLSQQSEEAKQELKKVAGICRDLAQQNDKLRELLDTLVNIANHAQLDLEGLELDSIPPAPIPPVLTDIVEEQ